MDGTNLAQGRQQWKVRVNAEINLQVQRNVASFVTR